MNMNYLHILGFYYLYTVIFPLTQVCVFRNGSQLVSLLLPWSSSHPSPSLASPAAFGLRGSATLETLPLINVEEAEAMATGSGGLLWELGVIMKSVRDVRHRPNKTCHNNNKHAIHCNPAGRQLPDHVTVYQLQAAGKLWIYPHLEVLCELKPWTYWSVSCVLWHEDPPFIPSFINLATDWDPPRISSSSA